ncbi:unnamed protein product [Camellia sinensis]
MKQVEEGKKSKGGTSSTTESSKRCGFTTYNSLTGCRWPSYYLVAWNTDRLQRNYNFVIKHKIMFLATKQFVVKKEVHILATKLLEHLYHPQQNLSQIMA